MQILTDKRKYLINTLENGWFLLDKNFGVLPWSCIGNASLCIKHSSRVQFFYSYKKNIFSPVRCTIIDLKIKMKDKAIFLSCISLWTSFHLMILVHVLCRTSVSQILDFSMYHKASFSQVLCLLVLEQLRLRHYNITMVLSSTISPKVLHYWWIGNMNYSWNTAKVRYLCSGAGWNIFLAISAVIKGPQ